MAKIYGLFGAMTGKLADTVMSVRNGEQLARKYQPVVFNPSTPAQVAQRAKLKLLSQLSAVMAPVIAMRKQGSVSSRNLFTKKNFGLTTYADNTASVNLNAIQLTSSVVSLPAVTITRGEFQVELALIATSSLDVNRVVYCVFRKMPDDTLRLAGSQVVSTPGANNVYGTTIPVESNTDSYVALAYGVRDNTDAARVIFADMEAPSARDVASVITTRTLLETDVTLTETRGATLPVSE